MNKGTIEDFCKLAPLSPESMEALNERRLMQSCGNHLPPNEASLSKHIAECEAQNEELRRIVRWYMRHSGVDIPEEMQAIFNKISGMSDHKQTDYEIDNPAVSMRECFACRVYRQTKRWRFQDSPQLHVDYWVCRECATMVCDFVKSLNMMP